MRTQIGENNCLLVFLEKADVQKLKLNAEKTDFGSDETKAILSSLYREAAQKANFTPKAPHSKVTELLPFHDGSMLICFCFRTAKPKLKVVARKKREKLLYEFSNKETFAAFLDAAEGLTQLPLGVYSDGCAYRFVLAAEAQQLENLLKEYALKITAPLALETTEEYWRRVY